jgi:hypothetical protein
VAVGEKIREPDGRKALLSHIADLGNRGYRRDSYQCSDQRIFDCGETGTNIDEIL